MPLLIPINGVGATDSKQPTVQPVAVHTQLVALTDTIVSPQPEKIEISVVDSQYQKTLAAKKAQKTTVAKRAVVQVATADPGLKAKRELAQRAAASYSIDWRVLEAVWQVESGKTWVTSTRSSAGAIGPCQFMPGTWRTYAQDGNGDGNRDVLEASDCLYGAARLLAVNGANHGNNVSALLSYNHSMAYVQKVLAIAKSIG